MRFRLCSFALLASFAIAGCGTTPANNTPVATDQIVSTLQSVSDKLAEIVGNDTVDPAVQEMKVSDYLKTLGDVHDVVIENDCVWGKFQDGTPFGVVLNRDKAADAPGERMKKPDSAPRFALPGSDTARLINTFGPAFYSPTSSIKSWLTDRGYTANLTSGSVEDLKTMTGNSVLYIDAHGGLTPIGFLPPTVNDDGTATPDASAHFVLATSTEVNGSTAIAYLSEIQQGMLVPLVVLHDYDQAKKPIMAKRFFITDRFIRKYKWSFPEGSLAFINSCFGNDQSIRNALFDAGASFHLGWTKSSNDLDAYLAGGFFFDRVLGANVALPKNDPPQRPFAFRGVWEAMKRVRKMDISWSTGIKPYNGLPFDTSMKRGEAYRGVLVIISDNPKLIFNSKNEGESGFLMPSIANVNIDEKNDQISLFGEFGDEPGTVFCGGAELAVVSWDEGLIKCSLSRTGNGSSGEIRVKVRGHLSNGRSLTRWSGPMIYTLTGQGTQYYKITLNVAFRADVGSFRNDVDLPPVNRTLATYATKDASLTWEAGGTYNTSPNYTESWVQNGPYPLDYRIPSASALDNDNWSFGINYDLTANTMSFGTSIYIKRAYDSQLSLAGSPPSPQPAAAFAGNTNADNSIPPARSGTNFDIPAGSRNLQQGTLYPRTFTWNKLTAENPPAVNAAQ